MNGFLCPCDVQDEVVAGCAEDGKSQIHRFDAFDVDIFPPDIQYGPDHLTLIFKNGFTSECVLACRPDGHGWLFFQLDHFRMEHKRILKGAGPGGPVYGFAAKENPFADTHVIDPLGHLTRSNEVECARIPT
jgi:hypothetical protein